MNSTLVKHSLASINLHNKRVVIRAFRPKRRRRVSTLLNWEQVQKIVAKYGGYPVIPMSDSVEEYLRKVEAYDGPLQWSPKRIENPADEERLDVLGRKECLGKLTSKLEASELKRLRAKFPDRVTGRTGCANFQQAVISGQKFCTDGI